MCRQKPQGQMMPGRCPLSRILHEFEAFICKAFKGTAVLMYRTPLITQQMDASGSPDWVKIFEKLGKNFCYKPSLYILKQIYI